MESEELELLLKECNVSEEQRYKAIQYVNEALKIIGLYDKTPIHKQQHIDGTPRRIVDVWLEFTKNLGKLPKNITTFNSNNDNIIIVDNIQFNSLCSHHFFPFSGKVHVAYLPDKEIIGLSKIPRIIKHFAKQPQVQENLTDEIADYLFNKINPKFVYVMIEAKHQCCASRGIESNSGMTTSAKRSVFEDDSSLIQEVLNILQTKLKGC